MTFLNLIQGGEGTPKKILIVCKNVYAQYAQTFDYKSFVNESLIDLWKQNKLERSVKVDLS